MLVRSISSAIWYAITHKAGQEHHAVALHCATRAIPCAMSERTSHRPSSTLGVEAAWTDRQPSGVALVQKRERGWHCVALVPSYELFMTARPGRAIDWKGGPITGSSPQPTDLHASSSASLATAACSSAPAAGASFHAGQVGRCDQRSRDGPIAAGGNSPSELGDGHKR
jgi:hypothetical protein